MGKLKSKILAWLADDDTPSDTPAQIATSNDLSDSVGEVTHDVPDDDDELPIYEASKELINRWHVYGDNVFLQVMLREYDLDYFPPNVNAYGHFKIGLNNARHEATFALDYDENKDAVHYLTIPFDTYNAAPIDREQARRVLEKISRLRVARRRFEDFCGVKVERFDNAN